MRGRSNCVCVFLHWLVCHPLGPVAPCICYPEKLKQPRINPGLCRVDISGGPEATAERYSSTTALADHALANYAEESFQQHQESSGSRLSLIHI